jgi:hypothetical protein
MSMTEVNDQRRRYILYGAISVVLIGLLVWGLVRYQEHKATKQAQAKAAQLATQLRAAGLPVLTEDTAVRLFGTDGGAVCVDPNSALRRALTNFSVGNGAGGPGQRPVINNRAIFRAEEVILSVYCSDKLKGFRSFENSQHLAGTS